MLNINENFTARFRAYLLADHKIRLQAGDFGTSFVSIDVDVENEKVEDVSVDEKASYVEELDNLNFTVEKSSSWDELEELLDANILESARELFIEKKRDDETLAEYCVRVVFRCDERRRTCAEFVDNDFDDEHSTNDAFVAIFSDKSVFVETDSDDLAYASINELEEEE